MREITAATAADYLRDSGRVPEGAGVRVRELAGGVSNVVLRVDVEGRPPFVLKQCRERLRTRIEWISRLDRIWTERAAMDLLDAILPAGTVPAVLFDDRENYLYAMECAPDDAEVWKARLMAGAADPALARRAGEVLGTIHAAAAGHPALGGLLADTSLFDQLRVDPYYRQVARAHPDLAPRLDALVASMADPPRPTFVHADFSPKNLLVHAGGLDTHRLRDRPCRRPGLRPRLLPVAPPAQRLPSLGMGGAGALPRPDPGVLVGLPRLLLGGGPRHRPRSIRHAAGCVLARIDGKSPVDYRDQLDPDAVRRFARGVMIDEPDDWAALLVLAEREMPS